MKRLFGLGETGFLVDFVDLLQWAHIGGGAQINAQVVFLIWFDHKLIDNDLVAYLGTVHDLLARAFHRVAETRVDDVLFGGTVDFFL